MLELVKRAVEAHVVESPVGELPSEGPLGKPGACFVTLRIGGRLRGCVGTTRPTLPTLAEELVRNAVSACSRDTRFSPVQPRELSRLQYSVYLLKEPEPVTDLSQLDPSRYGVLVRAGSKRGVLLPGIPGIDSVEQQLRAVRRKAGIGRAEPLEIERIEVIVYD